MSTIAQFVIELTADPTGIKTGLDRGVGFLNQFSKTADQTFRGLGSTGDAFTAAEKIVAGIETKFKDSSNRLRESLFRGVITRDVFERDKGVLAQAMNTTLLGSLEAFRSRGSFGTAIEDLFVSKLSDAGLKSGQAFADRFNERLTGLADAAESIGKRLSLAVTAPLVAGAGLGIREAIEGEADAARLNLAFGASVGEVQRALDALHERFPGQRKGLEEMAASTALLLRSIDIVGPTAQRMSVGLTEAAGVMGLIRTKDPSEILEKMLGGLRGNTRALGEFGITIKPTSIALEAQRLGLLKHGQALDETRRALASYSLIQKRVALEVANATGFENLASNQLRFLKRDAIEAAEAFGRTLLPAFTAAVRTLDGFAKTIAALPTPVLATITVIAGLAAVIGPLLIGLASLVRLVLFVRGAFVAAETITFLTGLTSLSAFVAAGGGLLIGLGLVLAAVLAIRNAMHGSDDDVAAFEASLAKLSKAQLADTRADLTSQLAAAVAKREELLKRASAVTAGGFGAGSGAGTGDALAKAADAVSVLEQKIAATAGASAKLNATLVQTKDTPLPTLPVDAFKEFLEQTNGTVDALKLVGERYALITRSVDSAVTLQGFVTAQLDDQAATVAALGTAYDKLGRMLEGHALTEKERALALREQLTITKAIADATDRSRLERAALAFGAQKLGALDSTEAVRDSIARGIAPASAALGDALTEARQAANTFADLIARGTIPATSANVAALEALRAAIARTVAAQSPAVLAKNALSFTTSAVATAVPGFDTSAIAGALGRAMDAASAFRDALASGATPATVANVAALAALDDEINRAADALDKLASVRSPGVPFTATERAQQSGRAAFQNDVSGAANNATAEIAQTVEAFHNIGLGFQREISNATAGLAQFVRAFEPANVVHAVLTTLGGVFRSVLAAVNPLAVIFNAIATATEPLAQVLADIGQVVAETLRPVFQAFEPVLRALIPLIRAIFEVLSPILKALAPLFQAFIPLLNALFPVFKAVAIVVTYLGQAVATVAGVILKIVGGLATAVGGAIAGIGTLISHIPFLGGIGRDIRDFGNGIKNFGHGALEAGDEAFKSAHQFAEARKEINAVNLDPAATAVDHLTVAAQDAAAALYNVPPGYRTALARFLATSPVVVGLNGLPPIAPPYVPPATPESPEVTSPATSEPRGRRTGPEKGEPGETDPGMTGGPSYSISFLGDINIDGSKFSPRELFDQITQEGMRRARSVPTRDGSTLNWYDVPTLR